MIAVGALVNIPNVLTVKTTEEPNVTFLKCIHDDIRTPEFRYYKLSRITKEEYDAAGTGNPNR